MSNGNLAEQMRAQNGARGGTSGVLLPAVILAVRVCSSGWRFQECWVVVGYRTEKESEGSSSLPYKGECGNSAAATRKMVPGVRTSSRLPALLSPQAGMAAARPIDTAQVSARLPGPHRPHPTRTLKPGVRGTCSRPAAQPLASRTVRH